MWHLRKRHLTIRCYKNPDRKQAYSAEVASGSNSDYGGENEQRMQIKSEESESSRGRGYTRGRGYFRGRGKTDGAPRGGGHQMMNFC